MRVVVDTNVMISVLLGPGRVPDRALVALFARGARLLFDARIEAEYRSVFSRPKFRAVDPTRKDELLARFFAHAEEVHAVEPWALPMNDPDDRMFVEVAISGRADAIVTGNLRDYPTNLGFEVLPPASLLAQLESVAPG